MRKIVFDNPYIVYGTDDVIESLYSFCESASIGRVYSRYREMSQSNEHNRLAALMDSLGFTGTSNSFSSPAVYVVQQWFGYDQDVEAIERLLSKIGEISHDDIQA